MLHFSMNCRYGLQISRALRVYRHHHRQAQIAKLKEVDKNHRSQTEECMRNMRQLVIWKAMKFRKDNGFLDKRSRSYYHRLQDIDKEDAKNGPSVAYIQTTEDDDDDECPSCGVLMEERLIAEHQVQNCPKLQQLNTQDCLTALASNSADS